MRGMLPLFSQMEHMERVWTRISTQPYSVSERQMGVRGARRFFPTAVIQLMPLNINWHLGTKSGQITAHEWHIILGWNMISWYPSSFNTANTCVGVEGWICQICQSCAPEYVNTAGRYASYGEYDNRCRRLVTFVCLQSLCHHSPASGTVVAFRTRLWRWTLTGKLPYGTRSCFLWGTNRNSVLY